jgi:hypothetical protein
VAFGHMTQFGDGLLQADVPACGRAG